MNNENDIQLLSQYIDGELPAADTQALRKRLLAEPGLRAEYDALRAADEQLKAHFDQAGAAEVPARVSQLLATPDSNGEGRRAGFGLAIAASILAASGLLLVPQTGQIAGESDGANALAQALESSASRASGRDELADGRQFRAVLSFPGADGNWCREYMIADGDSNQHGVACRENGEWQTRVQAPDLLPQDNAADAYRPAGANNAQIIGEYIDNNASGIPLSLKQESQLIQSNWN